MYFCWKMQHRSHAVLNHYDVVVMLMQKLHLHKSVHTTAVMDGCWKQQRAISNGIILPTHTHIHIENHIKLHCIRTHLAQFFNSLRPFRRPLPLRLLLYLSPSRLPDYYFYYYFRAYCVYSNVAYVIRFSLFIFLASLHPLIPLRMLALPHFCVALRCLRFALVCDNFKWLLLLLRASSGFYHFILPECIIAAYVASFSF